ncbi:MAG: DUF4440 domain-containing protein [Planctomycetota bacterium]|jgi:hypothetical protein
MVRNRWVPACAGVVGVVVSGCVGTAAREAGYRAELLAVHESFLVAHRENDWEFFRDFADETVYGLRDGEITTQTPEAMGERFEAYLGEAVFTRYEDLSEPVVFVSDDGTLGWVMAHVRIEGTYGEGRLDSTWSWVTLLERVDGEWRLVGSASTRAE